MILMPIMLYEIHKIDANYYKNIENLQGVCGLFITFGGLLFQI